MQKRIEEIVDVDFNYVHTVVDVNISAISGATRQVN